MKTTHMFPSQSNDALVFVTDYQNGAMKGWLSHPKLNSPERIASLSHLFLLLDDLLSTEDSVVNYTPYDLRELADVAPLATLRIQVLFREHYTWQGRVVWEEEHAEAAFRSELELLRLIDDLLSE